MPFYEYECEACGHCHEAMQKMSDKPLTTCPACGKARLVRLVSAPQFRLKGGGWYETDFKGDKDRKRNLADQAEPAAKADETAEAKPRVKSPKVAKPAKQKSAPRKKMPKAKSAKKAPARKSARKAARKSARKSARAKAAPKRVARPK